MPERDLVRLVRGGDGVRPVLSWGYAAAPGLALGRVHEFCGPARLVLAAAAMGRMAARRRDCGDGMEGAGGPVVWIRATRAEGRLNPEGLAMFVDPARLVLVSPMRESDVLWAAEEALRSGAAPLVAAECATPPGLTPVRRLHLAAEAGAEALRAGALAEAAAADGREGRAGGGVPAGAAEPPILLLLTPGEGGAQGVETRWALHPVPGRQEGERFQARWRLELLRARLAPPASWLVRWEGAASGASATRGGGWRAAHVRLGRDAPPRCARHMQGGFRQCSV